MNNRSPPQNHEHLIDTPGCERIGTFELDEFNEDLYWSERVTIELMDHTARRRGRGWLLWLVSIRLAGDAAYIHSLRAVRNELRLHGLSEKVVLDPFSDQEAFEYVARLEPALTQESFVRKLYKRTAGLPLFVAHVVSNLITRKAGSHHRSAGELLPDDVISEEIAEFIGHYNERLSTVQRALFEAAAVCGLRFQVNTLTAVLDKDAASALLARQLGADALLLLTDVDAIDRDFGMDTAEPTHELTLAEARELDLPTGSMGPEMAAASHFAESGGVSGIGRLRDALAILERRAGTYAV
ncbi:hypothetical protein VRRI112168_16500 [Vreelandella rituensis]|uniref:amino acid kinase family protein n=1 Tax=Vreelandella rituensis TaxID=2282306 RepID=UPI001F3EFB4D|nr:hypothetical protein [Halomonas rituensis]